MTPNNKAVELHNTMYFALHYFICEKERYTQATYAAKVIVLQIIEEIEGSIEIDWWHEVIKELDKIKL